LLLLREIGRQRLWLGRDARLLVYEQGIEPHVTVFDKSARQDGNLLPRRLFTYDHDGDLYYCPGGKMLTTTGSRIDDGSHYATREQYDCRSLSPEASMRPKEPARYVPRSIYEGARDMARKCKIAGGTHRTTAA